MNRNTVKPYVNTYCRLRDVQYAAYTSYAKAHGFDVVVTDHHEPGETIPEATAIVDPKRKDETYPFHEFCGAGVIFKVMLKLYTQLGKDLAPVLDTLDIVALATVADVVPLLDENRILVREGINLIDKETIDPGLHQIVDVAVMVLSEELSAGGFGHVVKNYNGVQYVHFGFISMGFFEESFLKPNGEYFEDGGRMLELSTADVSGFDTLLEYPIRVWCYRSSESDIFPGATYSVNSGLIDRLHGIE